MAVITLFRNPHQPLTVPDQLDGLAHNLAAESAETSGPLTIRQSALSLQCLEAGQ
jgi:hypothetical protein